MKFKSGRQKEELYSKFVWDMLRVVVEDAEAFSKTIGSPELVCTSVLRTFEEDLALHGSQIHVCGRAADLRASSWTDPYMVKLSLYLNRRYTYDSSRPQLVVALFKEHGNGPHCHIQISSRTTLRNPA